MKEFFEDLGKKLGETAETFTNKAGEVVEIQRIRGQIRALERSNDNDLIDLGKMIYDRYKSGEVIDAEALGFCDAISERDQAIAEYEQKIKEVKGAQDCDSCGNSVDNEMAYCPHCGKKMERPEKETTENDFVQNVKDTVEDVVEEVKDAAETVTDTVKDTVGDVAETLKENL